jgi:hypothetical protein
MLFDSRARTVGYGGVGLYPNKTVQQVRDHYGSLESSRHEILPLFLLQATVAESLWLLHFFFSHLPGRRFAAMALVEDAQVGT